MPIDVGAVSRTRDSDRPRRRLPLWIARLLGPEGVLLTRLHWLFLAFLAVQSVTVIARLAVAAPTGAGLRLAAALGLGGLVLRRVLNRAGNLSRAGDMLEGFVLFGVALALGSPMEAVGLAYAALYPRALRGSAGQALAAALTSVVALAAAAAVTPSSGQMGLASALAQLPSMLVVVLITRALVTVVTRAEQARARERTLLELAAELAASDDRERIQQAAIDGAAMLVPASAEARISLLAAPVAELTVVASNRRLSRPDLTEADLAALEGGRTVVLPPPGSEGLGGRPRAAVVAVPIGDGDVVRAALVVETETPLPDETREGLFTLSNQVAVALERTELAETVHAQRSEARFRALVTNSFDVIGIADDEGRLVYVSPAAERVLGYQPEQLVGQRSLDLVHPDDAGIVNVALDDLATRPGESTMLAYRLLRHDGSYVHVECVSTNLLHDADISGVVFTIRDVSERVALEEQLSHQAFHDSLTELANRALFTNQIGQALSRAEVTGQRAAVLLIDLDDFKVVNDSVGHAAGDEMLIALGQRLRDCLRPDDTAARLGGDEFAVLLEGIHDGDGALIVARRIAEAIVAPFPVGASEVAVSASIGIAIGGDGATTEELLRKADVALHTAKARGGTAELFSEELHGAMLQRLQLRADLQQALEQKQLAVHYQPIVDLGAGRMTGVEALVRWQHPERGMVSPADFIPIAEQSHLIIDIGRWVLTEACQQAAIWNRGLPGQPMTMSVNLSARQLEHPSLVDDVAEALEVSGLAPELLLLEITESLLAADADTAITQLEKLKTLNVRVAVDDFGTGYSALSYLSTFPVDVLKVDKSFIDGIAGTPEQSALGRAVVELGHALDLVLVAEGIERSDQLDALRELGCQLGQGYLFARPLSHESVSDLLKDHPDGVLSEAVA